ncbi:MAG: hypothetical protein ACRDHW_20445, partial [Ktedonobacteraceae bacterium]
VLQSAEPFLRVNDIPERFGPASDEQPRIHRIVRADIIQIVSLRHHQRQRVISNSQAIEPDRGRVIEKPANLR